MRILILSNFDGDLYRLRLDLIKELSKNNDIFIAIPMGEKFACFENIGCVCKDIYVDRRGMNPIRDIKLYTQYKKLMKEVKPDLVITYSIKCNIYGGAAAKSLKIPYAVNITGLGSAFDNGGLVRKLVVSMYKVALSKVKTVFFENDYNKQVFIDEKIVNESKCIVLNGAGVNLSNYIVSPLQEKNVTSLLFIGRVMKEKGVEELFDVAKRCKSQNKAIKFNFIGWYEDNYKEIVEQLVKDDVISYYGYQSDVKPFIAECDAIVLPSYHEGMSNALLEGAAMGRALLASNIPGCRESVIDDVSGYLFNKADANDLYDKVVKFANLTKEQKRDMGLAGRQHVENVFDRKKVVANTIAALMK